MGNRRAIKHTRFRVIKATQRPFTSLDVGGKEVKLNPKNDSVTVNDEGLARDLYAAYGRRGTVMPGQVIMVPVDNPMDAGHRRTFSVPELPWKKEVKDNGNEKEMQN